MLTNPVYAALTGPHSTFAETRGNVHCYPAAVAPFLGLPDEPSAQDWADAAELLGAGSTAALMRPDLPIPDTFKLDRQFDLVQFVAPPTLAAVDNEAVVLGPSADGTRGVCVFKSDSVDTVRTIVDGATAAVSRNEFYAINEGGALGLPA